ncbi:BolA family iron metabolism protein IbaG [Providencia sp. PROV188]|jgi:acid stress-induced BolA-like protein IbaG/YrbA|uniref:Acid stress-induced BolA-like protein IbaG/YrbA n=2 Tax=Providencia TaxID=586 RepID=A0A4R3NHA3_9GAMM|nr:MULTISPECIES: BolA family iron metabolism protein IbaG [Providencia]MTC75154.1 BolA/IbaG family iron-sulfur metabolism protein [Providencia sp. wls1919]ETS98409.1 BolA-like protein [Providencia alcalifaciens PAL-3]EUC97881.1 BolA-like protein [Providencia alcalifaciens PAL-1]MBC5791773.1 BolA family iron metabolism protein IbaG [Providencia sp. JUb39]MBG5883259.1 BolA family iron metabolism protein IbaG [Providencia alcalifaciens]
MDTNEIKQVLMEKLSLDEVIVNGDGSHFQVIAVGSLFDGMSRVKQQQAVYAPLMEYIADNRIHALSIKAYTPAQWERDRKLSGL